MNYLNELKNKKIIVLGLGISGLSTLRFFARENICCDVVDSREVPPNAEEALALASSTHFGALDKRTLSGADLIIISPGLALANSFVQQAIKAGTEVIGDVELFARLNTKPVYAVTGSNGKSSVVTLTRDVLEQAGFKVALAGNIGTPVLDVIDQEVDCYVLELSSFQLETIYSLQCTASCVLNISEDHMDRYEGIEDYALAKQRIHAHSDLIVVNQADKFTHNDAHNQLSFATSDADYSLSNEHFYYHGKALIATNELSVLGLHNQLNALAVMALLHNLSLDAEIYKRAFNQFTGLAHRCQLVAKHKNVSYINDSKATNIGATQAALVSLASNKNIILLAGGVGKGADFKILQPDINTHVKQLIAFGEDKRHIAALSPTSVIASSMEEAVNIAATYAEDGDVVLLAPACASFDMFKSFEHRGDVFSQFVKQVVST